MELNTLKVTHSPEEAVGLFLSGAIKETKKELHSDLTLKAFRILCSNLERFGNKLGAKHKEALMELVGGFTLMAFGRKKGRYAYPLDTGLGKTQAIVAWASALHELGYEGVSLAVSASQVEALCQLKRDLIDNGVPEEKIGLLHSYKYDTRMIGESGYASEPSTSDKYDRQIMLVTHARIKGPGNIERFNQYQGKSRNLLIWDESLLVSDSKALSIIKLRQGLGWISPRIGEESPVAVYLRKALDTIDEELLRQKSGKEPLPINLPELSGDAIEDFKKILGNEVMVSDLKAFLDKSQESLRVVSISGNEKGGAVYYDVSVSSDLSNICILDASYPIRELEKLDKTIKEGGKFSRKIKRYGKVTIHHLTDWAGRYSREKDFKKFRKGDRKVSSEVCNLVRQIPPSLPVLMFTFKTKEVGRGLKAVDYQKILKADLRDAGVDTEATVEVEEDGKIIKKPRFVWLTWGQETSLSQYSYCSQVVFAGVLHRSHLDLGSSIVGQSDDLLAEASYKTIKEMETSEIAHSLYQAMSRGSCRIIEVDQAKRMNVWLIHKHEDIRPLINEVMPGVVWKDWKGRHLKTTTKQGDTSKIIKNFLNRVPGDVYQISTRRLKQDTGLGDIENTTFTRALVKALKDNPQWYREEGQRSVKRNLFST